MFAWKETFYLNIYICTWKISWDLPLYLLTNLPLLWKLPPPQRGCFALYPKAFNMEDAEDTTIWLIQYKLLKAGMRTTCVATQEILSGWQTQCLASEKTFLNCLGWHSLLPLSPNGRSVVPHAWHKSPSISQRGGGIGLVTQVSLWPGLGRGPLFQKKHSKQTASNRCWTKAFGVFAQCCGLNDPTPWDEIFKTTNICSLARWFPQPFPGSRKGILGLSGLQTAQLVFRKESKDHIENRPRIRQDKNLVFAILWLWIHGWNYLNCHKTSGAGSTQHFCILVLFLIPWPLCEMLHIPEDISHTPSSPHCLYINAHANLLLPRSHAFCCAWEKLPYPTVIWIVQVPFIVHMAPFSRLLLSAQCSIHNIFFHHRSGGREKPCLISAQKTAKREATGTLPIWT